MMQTCSLCSQIQGDPKNDLIASMLPGKPYLRRILLESRSFAAMPSLGPLVSGHSLLCPRTHVRSFAQLAPALYAEFTATKRAVIQRLRDLYPGEIHIFEHGMATTGDRVVCTVDHAHMHVVPLPTAFDVGGDSWITFDGSMSTLAHLSGGREYVYYERPDGTSRLLVAKDGTIESQYMRKMIATGLGHGDHWDWRAEPDADAVDEAWQRFVSP